MKKILMAMDFSESSLNAFQHALSIAEKFITSKVAKKIEPKGKEYSFRLELTDDGEILGKKITEIYSKID